MPKTKRRKTEAEKQRQRARTAQNKAKKIKKEMARLEALSNPPPKHLEFLKKRLEFWEGKK
jgi:hypothetical protein